MVNLINILNIYTKNQTHYYMEVFCEKYHSDTEKIVVLIKVFFYDNLNHRQYLLNISIAMRMKLHLTLLSVNGMICKECTFLFSLKISFIFSSSLRKESR